VTEAVPPTSNAATHRYPVAAMTAIVLASLVVLMDTTFIVLALPVIADDLAVSGGAEWAVTAFLMTAGVSQVAAGWAADRFGQRRVFLLASAGFGLFAIALAASPNLGWLIVARCLQGACAGLMIPMATSITFSMFPEGRRATAVGLSGTVVMLGPLLAPLLSGWVLGFATWRWLVLVDVPFVLGVLGFGWARLPDSHERARRPFDGVGLVLVAAGLGALLIALAEADGWPVVLAVGIGAAGVGLVIAFVLHARRSPHSLIDLSIFAAPTFGVVLGIVAAVAVAQFARTVFVPLELQTLRGLSPLATGLALVPAAIASAIAMPVGGRWTDRTGGRPPVTFGLVLTVASAVAFGLLRVDTPLAFVVVLMVVNNVGIVLCTMPVAVMGLSAVAPRLVPQAAALRSLTRQVSGALGTAVLATIITAQVGELTFATASPAELDRAQQAYNVGFLVSAGVAAIGLVLARMLPAGNSVRSTTQRDEEETWLTS
jgi:EmrB/QacA subfamily drug resistance transporter